MFFWREHKWNHFSRLPNTQIVNSEFLVRDLCLAADGKRGERLHIFQKERKLTSRPISTLTFRPILDAQDLFRRTISGDINWNRLWPTFYVHLFVTDMHLRINKLWSFQHSSQMKLRVLRFASPCYKPPRILSWDTSESCLTFILSVDRRANEYQFAPLGKMVLYNLLNDRKYAAAC